MKLFSRNEAIALHLYSQGIKAKWSTGIHEDSTIGYGELDFNGFWQFPLLELAHQFNEKYKKISNT